MTAFQRLKPYFDSYNSKITAARNAQQLSIVDLAEQAGVSYSSIATQSAGRADNPKIFEQAAAAYVLGLSLDELCGLRPPADVTELTSQIHSLELDNVRKDGEIGRLNAVADGDKRHAEDVAARIRSLRSLVLALAGFCTLLVVVVIGYMIFDAHILTAGLFQSAGLSAFAVLLTLLLLAAVAAIAVALRHLYKK